MGSALLLGTVDVSEAILGAPVSTTLPHAWHSPHRPTQRLVVQPHSVHLRERRVTVEAMPRTLDRPADSRLGQRGSVSAIVRTRSLASGSPTVMMDTVATIAGHKRADSQPARRECLGVRGGPGTGRQPDEIPLRIRHVEATIDKALHKVPAGLHQLGHPYHQLVLCGQ